MAIFFRSLPLYAFPSGRPLADDAICRPEDAEHEREEEDWSDGSTSADSDSEDEERERFTDKPPRHRKVAMDKTGKVPLLFSVSPLISFSAPSGRASTGRLKRLEKGWDGIGVNELATVGWGEPRQRQREGASASA
jgi:hypothetical protein